MISQQAGKRAGVKLAHCASVRLQTANFTTARTRACFVDTSASSIKVQKPAEGRTSLTRSKISWMLVKTLVPPGSFLLLLQHLLLHHFIPSVWAEVWRRVRAGSCGGAASLRTPLTLGAATGGRRLQRGDGLAPTPSAKWMAACP